MLDVSYKKNHKFGFIKLDALLEQKLTLTSTVSQHPLETGEMLSDAIYNEPMDITLKGLVNDLPNASTALKDDEVLRTSKSLKAWSDLMSLWKAKVLISVSSTLQSEEFENFSILKIEVIETSTHSLEFTATLKEVVLGETLKKRVYSEAVGKQRTSDENLKLLKSYENYSDSKTVKMDYNESNDYYFFNIKEEGKLIQGDTKFMDGMETQNSKVTGTDEVANASNIGTFSLKVFA